MSYGSPQVIFAAGSQGMGVTPTPPAPAPAQFGARTPLGGVPLQASAGALLAAQVPNDGQQHTCKVSVSLTVTGATTNGAITLVFTCGGTTTTKTLITGTQGLGVSVPATSTTIMVDPGTSVILNQTALSAGAANLAADIIIT